MSRPTSDSNPQLRLLELVTELQLVEPTPEPTPEALAELESLLQSPGSRRFYIELVNIQSHLETLHTQRAAEESGQHLDAEEILEVLRQAEDAAPDYYVASQDHSALPPAPAESDDRPPLTMSRVTSAATYLLRQHITPRHLALAGIAAVLLLGMTIFIALQGGKTSSPTDTTPFTQTPGPDFDRVPVDRVQRSVATLTAQHNATWTEGALAPGSALHPNQRLTLTAGFAEITTNRGAVAMLEAPCTVELIDSPNALRLVTGKIVGICETDSSKGFLVRTPHMDITDLGTRFGIVAGEQSTGVRVLEGEIEVMPSLADANVTPTQLVAGQAALVDQNAGQVVLSDSVTKRFVRDRRAIVNIPELTGLIRYEPSMVSDLRVGASEDDAVRLFYERTGVPLDHGIDVNVAAPGRYVSTDWLETKTLDRVSVDSYFVHFDSPVTNGEVSQRTVTIRFDRPILGVITTGEQLAASQNLFGVRGVVYGDQSDASIAAGRFGNGLDNASLKANYGQNDIVQLSDDRRTLTLDLFVVNAIDQVRILVQSQKDQ